MVIALIGSVLLLASTYLPHIVVHHQAGRDRAFSLWDLFKLEGMSAIDAGVLIAVTIGVHVAYFGLRSRRSWSRTRVLRSWALVALVVDLFATLQLLGDSAGFDSEIVDVGRGSGFYLMIIAGISMVGGSIVGIVSPRQPSRLVANGEQQSPAPTPAPDDAPSTSRRLRELKSLLDDGLITPEEYEARRNRILDDI